MAKTYLLSNNGKNEGPFSESELTGKYLRGEITRSAKLCAVGENSWQTMSDLLESSASRKSTLPLILGIALLLVAGWCGLKASGSKETPRMRELRANLDSLDARVEAAQKDHYKRRGLNESVSSEQFVRELFSIRKAGEDERETLSDGLTEERRQIGEISNRYLIGALVSGGVGIGLLFVAFRIKPVTRPGSPRLPSSPSQAAQSASKPPVGQPYAPANPNNSPIPQPQILQPQIPPPVTLSQAPKEPKALCPACQQKVAFPQQMAGHQIACPACGSMMTLDDCSDVLG